MALSICLQRAHYSKMKNKNTSYYHKVTLLINFPDQMKLFVGTRRKLESWSSPERKSLLCVGGKVLMYEHCLSRPNLFTHPSQCPGMTRMSIDELLSSRSLPVPCHLTISLTQSSLYKITIVGGHECFRKRKNERVYVFVYPWNEKHIPHWIDY